MRGSVAVAQRPFRRCLRVATLYPNPAPFQAVIPVFRFDWAETQPTHPGLPGDLPLVLCQVSSRQILLCYTNLCHLFVLHKTFYVVAFPFKIASSHSSQRQAFSGVRAVTGFMGFPQVGQFILHLVQSFEPRPGHFHTSTFHHVVFLNEPLPSKPSR